MSDFISFAGFYQFVNVLFSPFIVPMGSRDRVSFSLICFGKLAVALLLTLYAVFVVTLKVES